MSGGAADHELDSRIATDEGASGHAKRGLHARTLLSALTEHLRALGERIETLEPAAEPAHVLALRERLERAVATAETLGDELLLSEEELQSQVEQLDSTQQLLDRAARTLAVEQRYYRDLFEFAPDPYVVTDPDGAILLANHAMVRLIARSEALLLGSRLGTMVPAESVPEYRRLLAEARRHGRVDARVFRLKPLGSPPIEVLVTVTAVRSQGGSEVPAPASDSPGQRVGEGHASTETFAERDVLALRWILRDVTASRRDARRVERLQALTSALSEATTSVQVAKAAVTHATAALGASDGAVGEHRDDTTCTVTHCGELAAELLRALHPEPAIPLDAPHPMADAIRTRAPILLESREAWSERYSPRQLAVWPRVEAVAAVPLELHGRVLGAIVAVYTEPCHFGPDERAFALTLARQCAQALERARLYEASEQARREAEASRHRAEEARRAAEMANRAKSEFLAAMSHELRTPINVILGYADLLEAGIPVSSPEVTREQAGRIRTAGTHLLELVEQVLTAARLGAAREGVRHEPIDVAELVRETGRLGEALLAQDDVRLQVDVPDEPVVILSDAGKVRQIVYNLVANAVKFTARGVVALAVRRRHADGPGGLARVAIEVRDTGIGIAPEHAESVFEPFWQAESETGPRFTESGRAAFAGGTNAAGSGRRGGTGLGLSISRELARLLGGELRLESMLGQGSTFTLELPVAPPPGHATSAPASSGVQDSRERPVSNQQPEDER